MSDECRTYQYRRKPKSKEFFPLIGRLRVAAIIHDLKNSAADQPLSCEEFATFLNKGLSSRSLKRRFSEQLEALQSPPFNSTNVLKLLHLGDEEGAFEVGLLQFISCFTKYSFGEMMMILINQDVDSMKKTQALIFQCVQYWGLSESTIRARLEKLGQMGFSYETYLELKTGRKIPTDRQIRILKAVLDADEDVVSEAAWLTAQSQDSRPNSGSGGSVSSPRLMFSDHQKKDFLL